MKLNEMSIKELLTKYAVAYLKMGANKVSSEEFNRICELSAEIESEIISRVVED